MIVTDGTTTVVDHNDYNLTIYEAADRLMNKEKIIACEHPDYLAEDLGNVYPDPEVLDGRDYANKSRSDIVEELRAYEQFGTYL